MTAHDLFEDALGWLRDTYEEHGFVVERDIVWTVQRRLVSAIGRLGLPYRVLHDVAMLPGVRADIVILDARGEVQVAAEFKYEPAHHRPEYPVSKLPVVPGETDGVGRDVRRICDFVDSRTALPAYSIFIDEGGFAHGSHPTPHRGSEWIDWGAGRWLLYSTARREPAFVSREDNVPDP